MSKRNVNLFSGPLHEMHKKFDRYRYMQNTTIVLSIIFFVSIVVAYLMQSKFTGDYLTAQAEQLEYEKALKRVETRQNELHAIAVRMKAIRKALDEDISFASQSARLTSLLAQTNSQASIDEIAFRNKHDFQTVLSFQSQDEMLEFIKSSESDDFRRGFSSVSVGEFNVSVATTSAQQRKITFSGSLQ